MYLEIEYITRENTIQNLMRIIVSSSNLLQKVRLCYMVNMTRTFHECDAADSSITPIFLCLETSTVEKATKRDGHQNSVRFIRA
jgi:hypothetical protein